MLVLCWLLDAATLEVNITDHFQDITLKQFQQTMKNTTKYATFVKKYATFVKQYMYGGKIFHFAFKEKHNG